MAAAREEAEVVGVVEASEAHGALSHRLLNTMSDTMMRCLCLSSSGALAGASSSACFRPAAPANLADGTRSTKMSRRSRPLAASSSKRPEDRPSPPKTMRALEGYRRRLARPPCACSASGRPQGLLAQPPHAASC